jgi:hypothetical protein
MKGGGTNNNNNNNNNKKATNSVDWVCKQTIPTMRPPLVDEVSANFCGYRVPRGQRDGLWIEHPSKGSEMVSLVAQFVEALCY